MIRAAGILFRSKDGRCLFLQRAPGGDYPGSWTIPGGKIEDGETAEKAAVRETREEAGKCPAGKRVLLARTVSGQGVTPVETPGDAPESMVVHQEQVDFTTFLQDVDEPFDVETDEESNGHAWASLDAPPQPLHPGCEVALRRLSCDELGVARMMAAGELTSPQYFANVALFDIRITGTGTSYRKAHDEYVFRPPDQYLTPDFLARCNGLPVLWEHPAKATLDSKEWQDRVVGTTFLPYVKGDEVWGIVKIYDDAAISVMTSGDKLSTSPTVSLDPAIVFKSESDSFKVTMEDGSSTLLVEGKPALLDHIAICDQGVWDKGGPAAGVNSVKADSDMSEDDKKAKDDAAKADQAKADQARADKARADDERWDKLFSKMDATDSRMDALEERFKKSDAAAKADEDDKEKKDKADKAKADEDDKEKKDKADKAKADESEKEEAKANEAANEPGAGDPKEVERKAREDAARKDAEEEKKRMDAARADAAEITTLKDQLAALTRQFEAGRLSDDDYNALGAAQMRADAVYSAWGQKAPRYMDGESLLAYRRRLAKGMQQHSEIYKPIDLGKAFSDEAAFSAAETRIFADALDAAKSPVGVPTGKLREIYSEDRAGRKIIDFAGQPRDWMCEHMSTVQRLLPGSFASRSGQ